MRKRAFRQSAGYSTSPDVDRGLEFSVQRMKVRWGVISVVHRDDDSEKT